MVTTRRTVHTPTRSSERLRNKKTLERAKQELASKPLGNRKRFRRPQQPKACRLLHLPGELRNMIYRYSLVSRHCIAITPTGPGEPELLRVCKRIRKDARNIYYAENRFRLEVTDYNGAAFTPFGRQYPRWEVKELNVGFRFLGQPDWGNLKLWIKDANFYGGRVMLPDMDDPEDPDDYIVGAALKIHKALGWYVPWPKVEEALEAYRHGLKGTCTRWASMG